MNSQSLRFICIAFSLFFLGCPEERIKPDDKNPLQLTVEDVTCTEAFLKLSFTPSGLLTSGQNHTVSLKRNDSLIATITINGNDSEFVDENLLPNKTYTYTLTHDKFSVSAQATTMDTTSSNFMWQIDTLGDGNSSILYDVAIVNDTLIYAVGELYLRDSSGKFDHKAYNLAKWNGKKWELQRIQFLSFCESNGTGSYPARAIWAFSANDIWITSGSSIVKYNGVNQTFPVCIPVSVNKLWGTSSSDLWAVGVDGGIAHYNGSSWQKIESGTTTPILDVWGTDEKIYCAVTNMSNLEEAKILTVTKNGIIDSVSWQNTIRINSIWHDNNEKIYVSGDGLFEQESARWKKASVPSYFYQRVRGSKASNVVAVGAFGMTVHYNGITWKNYPEVMIDGAYFGLDVKNKTVCMVGISGNRGVALVGKQQ